jgi:hypothetical protein
MAFVRTLILSATAMCLAAGERGTAAHTAALEARTTLLAVLFGAARFAH